MVQIKAWGWGLTRVRLFGELEASGFVIRRMRPKQCYSLEVMSIPGPLIRDGTVYRIFQAGGCVDTAEHHFWLTFDEGVTNLKSIKRI